ncbi:tRNA uracil 4-sulfurtransferase ThiI [Salinicola peritrichatus]|uniref:tRNA uracil 4-sulfurtransferase ThiI n=1 Tax=Salinicola peritrichatus TaxID=1267424 RepID=UPI000DA23065|nr:tRNA uracil 4-sulfurtransferase ThiI [Salinicola peritrichatus]
MRYWVKPFPEITIKSRSVRKVMMRCLRANIRNTLQRLDPDVGVSDRWDALEVHPSGEPGASTRQAMEAALTRISGIHEILAMESRDYVSFEDTAERLVPRWKDAIAGRSFRVSVRRKGTHDFTSMELERYLGGALLQASPSAMVKLTRPEVEVGLEIRDGRLMLVSHRLPGMGGYPLGTQGEALALISGGFDSPVATWRMIRRGLKTHFLFFNLGGPAHEKAVREVAHHVWRRYSASHRVDFISVPFEGVINEIQRQVPAGMASVVLKRMMIRAANEVAARIRVPALITGDALAQVSSQTLVNLGFMDAVSSRPILRPLIASDKQEIIADARHIGTASFAERLPEYCGVVSKRPNTRPSAAQVEEAEATFDFDVLDQAIRAASVTRSHRLAEETPQLQEVRIVDSARALAADDAVIDIRHPDERERAPLALPADQLLEIPFFELADRAPMLPKDRHYLLYCAQGVMSRMQALHLADRGMTHFGVYRQD